MVGLFKIFNLNRIVWRVCVYAPMYISYSTKQECKEPNNKIDVSHLISPANQVFSVFYLKFERSNCAFMASTINRFEDIMQKRFFLIFRALHSSEPQLCKLIEIMLKCAHVHKKRIKLIRVYLTTSWSSLQISKGKKMINTNSFP